VQQGPESEALLGMRQPMIDGLTIRQRRKLKERKGVKSDWALEALRERERAKVARV